MTEAHPGITYVSFVSYKTANITIIITILNDLDMKAVSIFNNHTMVTVNEKLLIMLCVGLLRMLVIHSSHFSWSQDSSDCILKPSGCLQSSHGASIIQGRSWFARLSNDYGYEEKYYCYILCFVDNILWTHHDADSVLQWLNSYFPLNPGYCDQDLCPEAELEWCLGLVHEYF